MFNKKNILAAIYGALVMLCIVIWVAVFREYAKDDTIEKQKNLISHAMDIICENYVDPLTDEDKEKLLDYAVTGMVASLEDPYSYYFDQEDFDTFEENMQEEYVGIGINVSFDADTGRMVVISPTDGGPAKEAGILPGDVVKRVDDLVVTKDNYNDVVSYIKGEGKKEGASLDIYVLRDGEEKKFTVTRKVIAIDTVSHKMLSDSVGYIRISEFKNGTVSEFSSAIDFIRNNDTKGTIIDLRNNPGGYAQSVIEMTDMLLPEGVIAYLEDSHGKREYFRSDKNDYPFPMVVLINEGTASAAELMAGSLQAHGLATVVGKKSFGKAVGQMPYMLTEDTAIYLTNARYFTPKGECIDKKGIMPDVEVDLPDEQKANFQNLTPEEDAQLRTAMEILYDKIK